MSRKRRKLIKVCFDRVLEPGEMERLARRSMAENPANIPLVRMGNVMAGLPPPQELALLTGTRWEVGRTLRVKFMGGEPVVQAKVEQYAHQWEQYANIHFVFGDDPDAEIRIAFQQDAGSWSYMGNQALSIPKTQPTMNLGWLHPNTANSEYSRVVLHEFGHALGCIHEHQNPSTNIPWNKPEVYRVYGGPPNNWPPAKVDVNLFQKYSSDQTQFSMFDTASIMLYPIPKGLTDGVFEVGMNMALSATDMAFIGSMYPFDTTPIQELTIGAAPVEANIGLAAEEDWFRFVVAQANSYVIETGGRTDLVMGLYGPNDRTVQIASDDDSGPGLNPRLTRQLNPGTYYLRLRHYQDTGIGKYTISVKIAG